MFPPLSRDPLDYFRRLYGDTVLNGAVHAMECGYKFFGPEQGEAWMKGALDQVKAIDLPQKEKDMILGENLQRLIERR